MSRTYKDRREPKYKLGVLWIDWNFSKKAVRSKIKDIDIPNGSAFKKYNRKHDIYGGL